MTVFCPCDVISQLNAIVGLGSRQEVDRAETRKARREAWLFRVGFARALFARILAAKFVYDRRAEDARELSDYGVGVVFLGAVVRERAYGIREQRVARGVGVLRVIAAVAVADVEAMILVDLVVYATEQRNGVIGHLERALKALEEVERLLGVWCRRKPDQVREKSLAILLDLLDFGGGKPKYLVLLDGAAD